MRNSDSGGAPSASRTRVLIGVTCVTSRTVRPAYRAMSRSRAAATRSRDLGEALAAAGGRRVGGRQPGVEVGGVALPHLGEGQPLPGAEVRLAQALLDADLQAEPGRRRPPPSPGSGAAGS